MPTVLVCSVENLPSKVAYTPLSHQNFNTFHVLKYVNFQIRNIGMTVVVFVSNLVLFTLMKILPFLLNTIDVHGSMIMHAILCMLGIIFIAIVLKETNGRSLDNIGVEDKNKTTNGNA